MPIKFSSLRILGFNVRKARERASLTQERLAEKSRLHPTYISGIERGVRNPTVLSLIRIAEALGVTISVFTHGIQGETGQDVAPFISKRSNKVNRRSDAQKH